MLAGELGADVEMAPLPAGDYSVGADTLVERKRVADLHSTVSRAGSDTFRVGGRATGAQ